MNTSVGWRYTDDGEIELFIRGEHHTFTMRISANEAADPKMFEDVTAWALGVGFIPGARLKLSVLQDFLDSYEEAFDVKKSTMHRPRMRGF